MALATYKESVRSKTLYSLLFFAAALVTLAALFGTVAIGDQVLVIKNFGLMSISLFGAGFAILSGTTLLHKELSKKTIYTILSKPVSRAEFIIGKYFGMLLTTAIMIVVMAGGLLLFTALLDDTYDLSLLCACLHIFFQLMVVCAAALLFSAIVVTPTLSGLFTLGLFLAGRSTEQVLYFINEGKVSGAAAIMLKTLYHVLPHLDLIDISNSVVFAGAPPRGQSWYAFLYAAAYAGVLLMLASALFRRRQFN
jgi:ABC-type transport system involved in multi-copper enzyme maturation permease subunit